MFTNAVIVNNHLYMLNAPVLMAQARSF